MSKALILAVVRLFINMPWVVAAAAAFYPKRRVSRRGILVSLTAIGLFIFASNIGVRLFAESSFYYLLDFLLVLVIYLVIMFFFALCYRLHPPQLIYVFCLLQAVSTMVNQTAYLIVHAYSGTRISILTSPPYALLMVGLSLLCGAPLYFFCRNSLLAAFETLDKRSTWRMCVVPLIFLVIFQITLPVIERFNGELSVVFLLLLLFATAILTYVVNVQMVLGSARSIQLQAKAESAQRLLTMQERNYETLQTSIEQAKTARHDLRFHLSVIQTFVQKNDWEGLSVYLDDYVDSISTHELKLCDNSAVDAIARHFLQQAESLGVTCDYTIVLPAKTGIADMDLCVVLGNLLENAVHALKEQGAVGYLRVRCTQEDRRIVVAVDNTLPMNRPLFQKGLGLQSVSAVAEKYNGDTKFEQADNWFKASVILHTPLNATPPAYLD